MFYSVRSILLSIGMGVTKFFIINWYFFKEPLWWMVAVVVFFWSLKNPPKYKNRLIQWLQGISITRLVLLYILFGLLTYIPISIVTNGSFPYRAENAICFLFNLLLLALIHFRAAALADRGEENLIQSFIYRYRFLLFSLLIFSTVQTQKVVQSVISGFFYHMILEERERRLSKASKLKEPVIYLDDYALALQKKLKETYPGRVPLTLKRMSEERPSLLFMRDYLDQEGIIRNVYGVEKVVINRSE